MLHADDEVYVASDFLDDLGKTLALITLLLFGVAAVRVITRVLPYFLR